MFKQLSQLSLNRQTIMGGAAALLLSSSAMATSFPLMSVSNDTGCFCDFTATPIHCEKGGSTPREVYSFTQEFPSSAGGVSPAPILIHANQGGQVYLIQGDFGVGAPLGFDSSRAKATSYDNYSPAKRGYIITANIHGTIAPYLVLPSEINPTTCQPNLSNLRLKIQ